MNIARFRFVLLLVSTFLSLTFSRAYAYSVSTVNITTPECAAWSQKWLAIAPKTEKGVSLSTPSVDDVIALLETYPGEPETPNIHLDHQSSALDKVKILFAAPHCALMNHFDAMKVPLGAKLSASQKSAFLNLIFKEFDHDEKIASTQIALAVDRAILEMTIQNKLFLLNEAEDLAFNQWRSSVIHLSNETRTHLSDTCMTLDHCDEEQAVATVKNYEYARAEVQRLRFELSGWAKPVRAANGL